MRVAEYYGKIDLTFLINSLVGFFFTRIVMALREVINDVGLLDKMKKNTKNCNRLRRRSRTGALNRSWEQMHNQFARNYWELLNL